MFVQGLEMSAVRKSTTVHVCTGAGSVCTTVTAQCFMFVEVMELSALRRKRNVACLYMTWNCPQFGKSTMLHDFTGIGTVCITVTTERYMFLQGMKLSAIQ